MIGRTPANIIAVRPMKDGVVADFNMAEKMIDEFIKKVQPNNKFVKPRILIGIPWGITNVEKELLLKLQFMQG